MAGSAWRNIRNFFGSIPASMKAYWGFSQGGLVHRAFGGPIQHLDSGGPSGFVTGPGTTTSDSIPTMLSDQEYVIRAWAAKRIGIDNLNLMNRTGVVPSAVSPMSGNQPTTQQRDGDIIIPVYIGGRKLDELVVSAQARANYKSGGR